PASIRGGPAGPPSAHLAPTDVVTLPEAGDARDHDASIAQELLRVARIAPPPRRAGGDDVAGLERDDRRDVRHECERVEHEVGRVGLLLHLAVDLARDLA